MNHSLPEPLLAELGAFLAEAMGLHFPPERWNDLECGLAAAAAEFKFSKPEECARWLLSSTPSPSQIEILAGTFTVGETYFFREPRTFEGLEEVILPELQRRRRDARRLRIWSAACCSGEEPYSIAITLVRNMPDLADWDVSICGTDINPRFLRKASDGVFGEWSFRNAPPWLRKSYFRETEPGRWEISNEIKRLVRFFPLNLAEDAYPSLLNETNAMDLIFCRNMLIYFSPEQAERVIDRLQHCLAEGGWLIVSCTETSISGLSQFVPKIVEGNRVFQKDSGHKASAGTAQGALSKGGNSWSRRPSTRFCEPRTPGAGTTRRAAASGESEPSGVKPISPRRAAKRLNNAQSSGAMPPRHDADLQLYEHGHYAELAKRLKGRLAGTQGAVCEMILLARALANLGQLSEALQWSDQAVAADKLNPAAYYLRAVILQEQGELHEAARGFRRTLYLNPEFVLAHFALGNLARNQGRSAEAERHFANALHLVRQRPADEPLSESDGLTAGRLMEVIRGIHTRQPKPTQPIDSHEPQTTNQTQITAS